MTNRNFCHSRESGNPCVELSVKWFAQRHEGTKKLLSVFVSLCELKSFFARQYRTMDSRFRGNDNVGAFGCGNRHFRHSELVCASTPAALGSISLLVPSICAARWMLKRVQHDVGGNASLRPLRLCVNTFTRHSRESGNLFVEMSVNWFAQRHEGTKRLLPVFVSSCEPKSHRARQYRTMDCPDGHYVPRFRGNDNVGFMGLAL
jgi:hypothetical protein